MFVVFTLHELKATNQNSKTLIFLKKNLNKILASV